MRREVTAFALSCFASIAAVAGPLPPAEIDGSLGIDVGNAQLIPEITSFGTHSESLSGLYGETSNASITIAAKPFPLVSSSASISSPFVNGAIADAAVYGVQRGVEGQGTWLSYSFEVIGPAPSVAVQVTATLGAAVSPPVAGAYGNIINFAGLEVSDGVDRFSDLIFMTADSNGLDGYTQDYSGNIDYLTYDPGVGLQGSLVDHHILSIRTNTVYTVSLEMYNIFAISGALGGGSMSISSFVDPVFAIAAGVANPEQYSILFSDGIGNTPSVSEPSSLVLSALGLIGILVVRRKCRRKPLKSVGCLHPWPRDASAAGPFEVLSRKRVEFLVL